MKHDLHEFTGDPDLISAMDELPFWSAPFGLRLLELVDYRQGMNVLDIGFGLGFPLLELAMRLGNSTTVYGIDTWAAAVSRVKMKIRAWKIPNVHPIVAQAEAMPFPRDSFRLVVSNNGINNVKDLEKTLGECYRVLETDGQFVFTMNTDQTSAEFYSTYRETLYEMGLQQYNGSLSMHIRKKRIPFLYLKSRVEEAGFEIHSVQEDSFAYRFASGTAMFLTSYAISRKALIVNELIFWVGTTFIL